MDASDEAAASWGQDHAYIYLLKVFAEFFVYSFPYRSFYVSSSLLFVCLFFITVTGWTSAALYPNHTMALQISSESTGCE